MRDLKVSGRRTGILLQTMGQLRYVGSNSISGLAISSLNEDVFIDLPHFFSQKEIPISTENIPLQGDVDKWLYLKDVNIPRIKAGVGLLIGTTFPKAMEPLRVINSRGERPYAVKIMLGWTVNGPLRGEGKGTPYTMSNNNLSETFLKNSMMNKRRRPLRINSLWTMSRWLKWPPFK